MDSRENVLKKYAFSSKYYDRQDDEKPEQEQTCLFKTIQQIDKKRRHMLDYLLLNLHRHQYLLSKIKKGWKDKKEELENEYIHDHDYKLMLSYYSEAFYIEKKRCIDILGIHFDFALESIQEFRYTLSSEEMLTSRQRFIISHRDYQVKLYQKLKNMCEKWRSLLFNEEFKYNVPIFVYEPDERRKE